MMIISAEKSDVDHVDCRTYVLYVFRTTDSDNETARIKSAVASLNRNVDL